MHSADPNPFTSLCPASETFGFFDFANGLLVAAALDAEAVFFDFLGPRFLVRIPASMVFSLTGLLF